MNAHINTLNSRLLPAGRSGHNHLLTRLPLHRVSRPLGLLGTEMKRFNPQPHVTTIPPDTTALLPPQTEVLLEDGLGRGENDHGGEVIGMRIAMTITWLVNVLLQVSHLYVFCRPAAANSRSYCSLLITWKELLGTVGVLLVQ